MAKRCIIILLIIFMLYAFYSCYSDSNDKYPYGRDTAVYIGDGRFQIARAYTFDNKRCNYVIIDGETQLNIDIDVYKYVDMKKEGKLYIIGSMGYTIVDYQYTKSYEQHETIGEFSDTDQKVFNTKKFDYLGKNYVFMITVILLVVLTVFVTIIFKRKKIIAKIKNKS